MLTALAAHALGDLSMREYSVLNIFFLIAATLCYLVFTVFLLQDMHKMSRNHKIMSLCCQFFLVGSILAIGGPTILSGKAGESLPQHLIIMLCVVSIIYKTIWTYLLYKIYDENERSQERVFLPLGKRKWHGKVIDIGDEERLLQRWESIWTSQMKQLEAQGYSLARIHIDPFLAQHVGLAFSGTVAIRISPTSERSWFQNKLRIPEIEEILPRSEGQSLQIEALFVVGRNERDTLSATIVEIITGSLIVDENEYFFQAKDGHLTSFLRTKCRPNVVHTIAIANKAQATVFHRPSVPEANEGGWFTLDIYRNYRCQNASFFHPSILKRKYFPVLKKLNTKNRCRNLTREVLSLAKQKISWLPWSFLTGEDTNFKKLVHLDWCESDELIQLNHEFFRGEMSFDYIFVDSLDFTRDSKIIGIDGTIFGAHELYGARKIHRIDGLRLE